MSTNGASEPSMEEILASIRNIIAQDPAESEPDGGEKSASTDGDMAKSLSLFGSLAAGLGPEPAQPKAAQPFGGRPAQSDRQVASAQQASAQGQPLRRAQQTPDAGTRPTGFVAGPVSGRPSQDAAPAKPASAAALADDFSDVFEEPLQQIAIAPAAGSRLSSAEASGRSVEGHPAASPTVEPQQNKAATGASALTTKPEPKPEAGAEASPATNLQSEPDPTAAPAGDLKPTPSAGGFDFATLRARSPGSAAGETPAAALENGPETEPFVPASSDAAATRDDQTPTEPAAATEPAQPVVIAAMPQKSAEQTIPATSGDFGDGHDQGSSVEKAEDPAQKPTDDAARKADAGFKSANVGFLAATPRPLDSKAAGPAGGGDFFKAVAGAARALADDDALQADTLPSESQFAEQAEVEPKVASFATAATPSEEAAATAPSVTEPEPKPIEMQKEPVIAAANEVSVGDGLSVSNILMTNDAGGIRTLEDTVADLLRPLLREWLENNMPRIVENALRIEVAESVKKQLDTSTRKPNGLS